ncbi:MAG: ACT domain-containing protein, partial [Candidatus Eisenbacteria bacterium]
IEVEWDVEKDAVFIVNLLVTGTDRQNLLADIARAISGTHTNIQRSAMSGIDGEVRGRFVLEVRNAKHLHRAMKAVSAVRNVTRVERGQLLSDVGEDDGGDGTPRPG